MKRAQIAIEYLFLVAFSLAFFVVLIFGLTGVSAAKSTEKAYVELDDFARSIQQELILAATVQDGYARILEVPPAFNGRNYTLNILNETQSAMLLEFVFEEQTLYYRIPDTRGTISRGIITIQKIDGEVVVS